MFRTLLGFAVALAIAGPAYPASFLVNSNGGTIAEVDTTTGNLSNAFDAGLVFFDIAIDDLGTGYGVTNTNVLYSIDLGAQSTSFIGNTGFLQAGLAFEFGGLFGSGGNNLYSIDSTTGVATIVGPGVGGNFNSSGDIAFAGGDLFYATSSNSCDGIGDCLWTIDANSGVGTIVGATGFDDLVGLVFIDGELFGTSASDNNIYLLDTITGAGTFVNSYDFGADFTFGAAVAPSSVAPIPVNPSLPLLISGILMLALPRRRN